jgi:hypothetical protein
VSKLTNKLLLGQLVADLGWVSQDQFNRCLELARELNAPTGHILRAEGYISDSEMHSLIIAQSMIRDGYINIAQARKALSMSTWWSLPLEEVLAMMGLVRVEELYANRLGELLVDAGWLEKQALVQAISVSKAINVPLGEHLVAKGWLSKSMLALVLDLQTLLRNGQMERQCLVQALKAIPLTILNLVGTDCAGVENLRLGQMLANARLITHAELISALELAQINKRPLGEMMLVLGLISEKMLDAALRFQKMTIEHSITPREAAFSLYRTFGVSICRDGNGEQATAAMPNASMTAVAFLQLVRGLDCEALKGLKALPEDSAKCKIFLDELDCNVAQAATRCSFLIKRSALTLAQAAFAFHWSRINDADVEQFLFISGWVTTKNITRLETETFRYALEKNVICA